MVDAVVAFSYPVMECKQTERLAKIDALIGYNVVPILKCDALAVAFTN